jgi:uncharacterized protein YutD
LYTELIDYIDEFCNEELAYSFLVQKLQTISNVSYLIKKHIEILMQ